jgi:hypothetical protein
MTDRYAAFTVTLDQDIREDDAQAIINAIKMVKHVRSVTPHVANWEFHTAVERVRFEIWDKVREAIYPDWKKKE